MTESRIENKFWAVKFLCHTDDKIETTPNEISVYLTRKKRNTQNATFMFLGIPTLKYYGMSTRVEMKILDITGVTIGLGTMLGQFLGGHLSSIDFHIAGWRWIFFINVPICLLALLASWVYLKETVLIKNEKFDYSGTVVLTVALISLIYPLTQGREHNWPFWCILLLILSVCLFYYFIKDQIKKTRTNKSPLIDVRLFKYSNFNLGLLVVSGFYMMLDSFFLMLSLFFQDGLAMNAIDAGTVIVVQGAGLMVSSVLAIRFIANHGKRILQAGVILIIISIVLQIVAFRNESISYGLICFLLAIHGFGVGLVLPSIVNVALRGIPSEFSVAKQSPSG